MAEKVRVTAEERKLIAIIRQIIAEDQATAGPTGTRAAIARNLAATAGTAIRRPATAVAVVPRTTYKAVRGKGVKVSMAQVKRLTPRLQAVYMAVRKAGNKGLSSLEIERACKINRNAVSGAVFSLRQIGLLTNR